MIPSSARQLGDGIFYENFIVIRGTFLCGPTYLQSRRIRCRNACTAHQRIDSEKETMMDGITGLVAVIMLFGMPTAVLAMYTFYRVRKLRTEERMAAITRGVSVPMEPELSEASRSRRFGILLVAGAIGYMLTFTLIARVEPDAWVASAFGAIPL